MQQKSFGCSRILDPTMGQNRCPRLSSNCYGGFCRLWTGGLRRTPLGPLLVSGKAPRTVSQQGGAIQGADFGDGPSARVAGGPTAVMTRPRRPTIRFDEYPIWDNV